MSHIPHMSIAVRALIFRDKSVLCAYYPNDNHYSLPGGRVEPDESLLEALQRECEEELGLSYDSEDFVALLEHRFSKQGQDIHELTAYFKVETEIEQFVSQEPGLEFKFIPVERLASVTLLPEAAVRIIHDYCDGKVEYFYSTLQNI